MDSKIQMDEKAETPPGLPPAYVLDTDDKYDRVFSDYSSDSADNELLKEALDEEDEEEDEDHEARDGDVVDERDFNWMRPARPNASGRSVKLELPVAIPQTTPGLKPHFSRAYAPILEQYDVPLVEWIAFLDHLNVCKHASPPLQILGLAGMVAGFMPIPYALAISLGVGLASGAAQYATAYVRLKNYIVRTNKEYFIPRGLLVRIAKQALFKDIINEPEGETAVAPAPDIRSGQTTTLRERRLKALEGRIAPLQFAGLPKITEEQNVLDQWSRRRGTRKTEKKEGKHERKGGKAARHAERRMRKLDGKMEEAVSERELAKLARRGAKVHQRFEKRGGGGSSDSTEKHAKKFLWVVVEDLETGLARLKKAEYEAAANRKESGS